MDCKKDYHLVPLVVCVGYLFLVILCEGRLLDAATLPSEEFPPEPGSSNPVLNPSHDEESRNERMAIGNKLEKEYINWKMGVGEFQRLLCAMTLVSNIEECDIQVEDVIDAVESFLNGPAGYVVHFSIAMISPILRALLDADRPHHGAGHLIRHREDNVEETSELLEVLLETTDHKLSYLSPCMTFYTSYRTQRLLRLAFTKGVEKEIKSLGNAYQRTVVVRNRHSAAHKDEDAKRAGLFFLLNNTQLSESDPEKANSVVHIETHLRHAKMQLKRIVLIAPRITTLCSLLSFNRMTRTIASNLQPVEKRYWADAMGSYTESIRRSVQEHLVYIKDMSSLEWSPNDEDGAPESGAKAGGPVYYSIFGQDFVLPATDSEWLNFCATYENQYLVPVSMWMAAADLVLLLDDKLKELEVSSTSTSTSTTNTRERGDGASDPSVAQHFHSILLDAIDSLKRDAASIRWGDDWEVARGDVSGKEDRELAPQCSFLSLFDSTGAPLVDRKKTKQDSGSTEPVSLSVAPRTPRAGPTGAQETKSRFSITKLIGIAVTIPDWIKALATIYLDRTTITQLEQKLSELEEDYRERQLNYKDGLVATLLQQRETEKLRSYGILKPVVGSLAGALSVCVVGVAILLIYDQSQIARHRRNWKAQDRSARLLSSMQHVPAKLLPKTASSTSHGKAMDEFECALLSV